MAKSVQSMRAAYRLLVVDWDNPKHTTLGIAFQMRYPLQRHASRYLQRHGQRHQGRK